MSKTEINPDYKVVHKNGKWYADFKHATLTTPEKNYGTGNTHYMTVHDSAVGAYNALCGYVKSLGWSVKDEQEWLQYFMELDRHVQHMESIRPQKDQFDNESAYARAYSAWSMKESCDAPNKPGYYRANND
jgi:hypothetical protein